MKIDIDSDGLTRLDVCLVSKLQALYPDLPLSRRWLKRRFVAEQIRLGGRAVGPSAFLPRGTHQLEIREWDAAAVAREFEAQPSPGGAFIRIAYEDERILVLDKPAGTASAPHSGHETDTAVNSALAHFPDLRLVGNSALEPGLLHRLDTATRGLLLFAKTRAEYLRLKKLWKAGQVAKIYRARVSVLPDRKLIEFALGHAKRAARKMVAIQSPEDAEKIRGRALPARTEILEVRSEAANRHSLVVQLHTGVMHQIRCHLAAIGSPIIGDDLYGGAPVDGLELQAWKLIIPGANGGRIEIQAPE